jgi:uncharacterized protein YegL
MEAFLNLFENIYFQIAAGAVPVCAVFGCMFFASPAFKARNAALALCGLLGAGGAVTAGVLEDDPVVTVGLPDGRLYAYALAHLGEWDLAAEAFGISFAYDEEDTLARARLSVLTGRDVHASALYLKAGIPAESQDTVSREINAIMQDPFAEPYKRAAAIGVFAEHTYADFIDGYYIDIEEVTNNLRRLRRLYDEVPELTRLEPLRLSRLKMQIMAEDFRAIAESVSGDADHNELLIVSELYMNGFVKANHFSPDFRGDTDEYRIVADEMNRVYDDVFSGRSRDEREEARNQIRSLNSLIRNPALNSIMLALENYADGDFSFDRSKVYMQLAKIAHSTGDETAFARFMDRSFGSVGDCDDPYYTIPMYEIIGLIADKDSPERLRNVASYTEKVLRNVFTVDVSDMFLKPVSEGEAFHEGDDFALSFQTQFNTFVNQRHMAINIVNVNADNFRTVVADISVSGDISRSVTDLRQRLQIVDCGVEIRNFTLEKVSYSKANILLCVDVSGSMQGQPIADLREGLRMFVESAESVESIALITFHSGISGVWTFGTPNADLLAAIANIRAGGGTNMYDAMIHSLDHFEIRPGEINYVILMSDGEDNTKRSLWAIEENIGVPYRDKGVVAYTVGVGSDSDDVYLSTIANSTGGSYVYGADSAQIMQFFNGLRAQALNRYLLKFDAADTTTANRTLEITLRGEGYIHGQYRYRIDGAEQMPDLIEVEPFVTFGERVFYGFDEKLIYTGGGSRIINLKGEGFEPNDVFTVTLAGNINYTLTYNYIDSGTLAVNIPAGIASGLYDVHITIGGQTAVLREGFAAVVQGSEKITRYGPYTFTSYFRFRENNMIRLAYYVTMNDGTRFKGDVYLFDDETVGIGGDW